VLSADTGYARDYERNPYGDYDQNDQFLFAPSTLDERFDPKLIMVAFALDEQRVAVPWLALREARTLDADVAGTTVTMSVDGSELVITDGDGRTVPFYFEMWFSWAVQNGDSGIVLEP
jgi:hypothetical protein